MADKYTNLGKTLSDLINENTGGIVKLSDAYKKAYAQYSSIKRIETTTNKLEVKNDEFYVDGEFVGYNNCLDKVGALLKIPVPYLERLGIDFRCENINYWLKKLGDHKVILCVRNLSDYADGTGKPSDYVVDFRAQDKDKIELVDCLKELLEVLGGNSFIMNTDDSLGYTQIDILIPGKRYQIHDTWYNGGIRFVLKKKFQAPEVSPILFNEDSCAIIEFNNYLSALSIRDLAYDDIMRVINEKIDNAYESLDGLAYTFTEVSYDEIRMMRKRIIHVCEEHGLPTRIKYATVTCFDEYRVYSDFAEEGTVDELASLLSSACFISEIKSSSVRKLQMLAGYVILKAHHESRCKNCDAILIDD